MKSSGAIPVLAVLNLAVSAFVAAQIWRQAPADLLGVLCAASVAGFPIGLALFRGADVSDLKLATGLVIMIFALLLLARERGYVLAYRPGTDAKRPRWSIALFAGALSGIMGAALAMPGPVAMLYISTLRLSRDQSRALSLAFFSFVYAAVCLLHAWDGALAPERGWLSAKLLLAVVAGGIAGQWLSRHVPEARYRQLVLVILFVAGFYAVLSI
jgi:uncharacterized membrane protein YfcA